MRQIITVAALALAVTHYYPVWSGWLPGGELDARNRELARITSQANIPVPDHSGGNREYLAVVPMMLDTDSAGKSNAIDDGPRGVRSLLRADRLEVAGERCAAAAVAGSVPGNPIGVELLRCLGGRPRAATCRIDELIPTGPALGGVLRYGQTRFRRAQIQRELSEANWASATGPIFDARV